MNNSSSEDFVQEVKPASIKKKAKPCVPFRTSIECHMRYRRRTEKPPFKPRSRSCRAGSRVIPPGSVHGVNDDYKQERAVRKMDSKTIFFATHDGAGAKVAVHR
jgi:hypothetical protein